jgi:integrase
MVRPARLIHPVIRSPRGCRAATAADRSLAGTAKAISGLTSAAIAIIVKRAVVTAALAEGLSREQAEAMAETFSGHSLRAGHAMSAAQNDAPAHAIQRQLRHKSFNTTAGYIREGRLFKGSSASLGLR